jgi:hypothetical protein
MRQSEFYKINAALDRAEFAIDELRKKAIKLQRKRALAKTSEAIAALDLEAHELLRQLRKVSEAVHSSNPAPHLRLVSDTGPNITLPLYASAVWSKLLT